MPEIKHSSTITFSPDSTTTDGLQVTTSAIYPETNSGLDLGITGTNEFANLYLSGTAYVPEIKHSSTITFSPDSTTTDGFASDHVSRLSGN